MIKVMIFDGGKASYLYMILWKRKESKRLFRVIGKTFWTACRIIVMGMILYSYFSHNPYLVSLFTFIYRQTFHLLLSHQYAYLCYYTIERGQVYLWACGIKGLRFLTIIPSIPRASVTLL